MNIILAEQPQKWSDYQGTRVKYDDVFFCCITYQPEEYIQKQANTKNSAPIEGAKTNHIDPVPVRAIF
jgi:hypothetical protein